jgi:5'-nucleotidase (lipoprotein e(P4) family)
MLPRLSFAAVWLTVAAVFGCTALAAGADTRAAGPKVAASERATLWLQTSAEYRSLALSAYNTASPLLEHALDNPRWTAALEELPGYADLPPAVILDIDETALDNSPFQASVVKALEDGAEDRYYPAAWDTWIALKRAKPVPGAPEFVWAARTLGIEAFFITNRECKPRLPAGPACPQEADTLENLRLAGFPPTDPDHLLLKQEQRDWTSEKSSRRALIAQTHRILMLVGDDLGDFLPGAKTMSLTERAAEVEAARTWWGTRWIILPNPVYGSWYRGLGNRPADYLEPVSDVVDAIEREIAAGGGTSTESGAGAGESGAPIRVATWNMNNLHSVIGEPLRSRAPARSAEDYATLRKYADRLGADIIALQEVNGPDAAALVFPRETYELYMSGRFHEDQRTGRESDRIYTGFAVRKGVFDRVVTSDYEDLSVTVPGTTPRPTRWGVDLLVERGGRQLRLLSVHLKSGCSARSLTRPQSDACRALALQREPLEAWIDARTTEGVPFLVLGDFNRAFDVHGERDHLWQEIDDADPPPLDLVRLPTGRTSQCWQGTSNYHENPIDFIVLDEQVSKLLVAGSFFQLDYAPEDRDIGRGTPSDHCPEGVDLRF